MVGSALFSRKQRIIGNINGSFEKGILCYNNGIQFKKTGKEIKERLSARKVLITNQCNMDMALINQLQTAINEKYQIQPDSQNIVQLRTGSTNMGNTFSWSLMDNLQNDEQKTLCQQCNDVCYRLKENARNLDEIDFIMANMPDNATYELPTEQLINFGF